MPPQPGGASPGPRPGPRAVAEGVQFIRRSQPLAGAFLIDLNATEFGLTVALFPAINAERFGGRPGTLGLFSAAIGVGGLVSAALSGPIRHVVAARPRHAGRGRRVGRGLRRIRGGPGPGADAHPATRCAGAVDTFTVVFRQSILQAVTPEHLRGRVLAADYVVAAGGPQLGNLEAGALASLTTPVISALTGGLVTVAGCLVIGVALPGLPPVPVRSWVAGRASSARRSPRPRREPSDRGGLSQRPPSPRPSPGLRST